jgi:ABC-type Mn2+/Zn2+ transport system permease subunit
LVIVPAIAARNLSPNMFRYTLLSAIFGVISGFSGVLLASYFPDVLPGPLVVFSGIAIFGVTIIVNWRKKLSV